MSGRPEAESFAWSELLDASSPTSGSYLEFLERPSLSAGVYRLAAGASDPQQPHDRDEVYYVVRGRSILEVGERRLEARPGSVLFVAAGAAHRFVEIEEDLELLVLFAGRG